MIRAGPVSRLLLAPCLTGVMLCFPLIGARATEDAPAAGGAAEADAAAFCANIGDGASGARMAWEARTLNALKAEIEAQTAELETKRQELEEWVRQREAFRKLAEETVIDIYARMRPDAAAAQLAALDPRTAAAVLTQLKSRAAGAILAEMDTSRAVMIATLISAGSDPDADIGATQ